MAGIVREMMHRCLPSRGGRVALQTYVIALLLGLLCSAALFLGVGHCQGEFCFLGPFFLPLGFSGAVLYALFPHAYWSFENIPGFSLVVFALNLFIVYGAGVLIERLLKRRQVIGMKR